VLPLETYPEASSSCISIKIGILCIEGRPLGLSWGLSDCQTTHGPMYFLISKMVDSVLKCYQELVKIMIFLQKNVFLKNS
jgi:hypothetical protein